MKGLVMENRYKLYEDIIAEMAMVYKNDKRPWMIGYSGGKDSTLLCCLVFEMAKRLKPEERNKDIYIVTSDTMVENPIVKKYMHRMSKLIGEFGKELNIKSDIIYPKIEDSFWVEVIGLGYPTPKPPNFRWCTERLKIKPMTEYTINKIKNNGEVVILLGVRKAESSYRAKNIRNREIEGKLLVPHNEIANAYVYNPLKEIPNENVWEFLLSGNAKTPWGSDNKYLFSLYQGENLGEEQSVIGEVDENKIPVTGNSRFGCWVCTMVKEDKSLKAFIDKGEKWLIPLRDFRNWLIEIRDNGDYRDKKRRNGAVYLNSDGNFGYGPFSMSGRYEILKRLLILEKESGLDLITLEELKKIDEIWDKEGDLTRRKLVDLYSDIFHQKLPWDDYKYPLFSSDVIELIKKECDEYNIEFEMFAKLMIEVNDNKMYSRTTYTTKSFDKIINQGWLHYGAIKQGLDDADK